MINVVHSSRSWLPQTQVWVYNQIRRLPGDIKCSVVCEATENLDQFDIEPIYCFADAGFIRRIWDRALRKARIREHLGYQVVAARKSKADIIHSHFGQVGWADIAVARKTGARHVTTFYGWDVNFLPKSDPRWFNRYKKLFDSVDIVLCEGPFMASCIARLGCPEEKLRVQHLGVNVDEIEYSPRRWDGSGPLRILLAAAFREKKGLPYAIEAIGKIRNEIPVEVTIIGDAAGGERARIEKQKILDAIERNNLRPFVRMLGYQPYSVFVEEARKHHIFLSPSVTAQDGDTEGGAPVSLIDMAASGMLIISTRHCDIPEVIKHNETGLLAEERDVNGLVEHIRWAADNPDKWAGFQLAGRRRMEQEFNARVQGEKLADIYRELAG